MVTELRCKEEFQALGQISDIPSGALGQGLRCRSEEGRCPQNRALVAGAQVEAGPLLELEIIARGTELLTLQSLRIKEGTHPTAENRTGRSIGKVECCHGCDDIVVPDSPFSRIHLDIHSMTQGMVFLAGPPIRTDAESLSAFYLVFLWFPSATTHAHHQLSFHAPAPFHLPALHPSCLLPMWRLP